MIVTQLDTFVQKFHQLWQAGVTAHLDLDTHAGYAWVGLRVQLGNEAPGPIYHPVHRQSFPRSSSSRDRRRARRLAARAQTNSEAAEEAVTTSEQEATETSDTFVDPMNAENDAREQTNSEAVGEAVVTSEQEATETSDSTEEPFNAENDANKEKSEEEIEKVTEEATEIFECLLCDFSSTWNNGLKVHMGRKHRNIDQIDGNSDEEVLDMEKKYESTEGYWKRGRLGIAFYVFVDCKAIIDASDISEEEKLKEKEKLIDARKAALGSTFHQFPPWSK